MADNIKIVGNILNTTIVSRYSSEDTKLIPSKNLAENFGGENNYIEFYIYDIAGNLLSTNYNYLNYKLPPSTGLTPGTTSTTNTTDNIQTENVGVVSTLSPQTSSLYPIIEIDPIQDLQDAGYSSGEFNIRYNLFQNILSNFIDEALFIKEISPDRTEIRLGSTSLTDDEIESVVLSMIDKINNSDYYVDYLLNFGNNEQYVAINVALNKAVSGYEILLKLYQSLPNSIQEKQTLWIVEEKVSPYIFDINLDKLVIPPPAPTLRGPNFGIEIPNHSTVSTQYTNYNTLVTGLQSIQSSSYNQILNLLTTQSINISVDYTDFDNFIFFGSAYQRLSNFYTKVKQIETYNNLINNYTPLISTTPSLITEINQYSSSINTIITQFDGYESYLYFESSSYAWPKSGSLKPYKLLATTTTSSVNWYNNILDSALYFDKNNPNNLEYAVPNYLKNDPDNQPFLTFLNMVGHYFDNIWIYLKAITDVNKANNNLNAGISKDLVYNQLKSLGLHLYNSQAGEDVNKFLIGANTGSGVWNNNTTITGSYLNNIPRKDLVAELYKRIYHNLPLLLKQKGTVEGLDNLISIFGIPSRTYYKSGSETLYTPSGSNYTASILNVKEYGGANKSELVKGYNTDKVRIVSNTITGSLLSPLRSLQTFPTNPSDFRDGDMHYVDVSFSPQTQIDTYASKSIASNNPTWSLDDFIGDPRQQYSSSYSDLDTQRKLYYQTGTTGYPGFTGSLMDYNGFIRLIQYFDNSLFKMLEDFVPERASLSTGVTINSPVLERNKAVYANPTTSTTQSIYNAEYSASTITAQYGHFYDALQNDKKPYFDGVLSGSIVDVHDQFEQENYNPYLLGDGGIKCHMYYLQATGTAGSVTTFILTECGLSTTTPVSLVSPYGGYICIDNTQPIYISSGVGTIDEIGPCDKNILLNDSVLGPKNPTTNNSYRTSSIYEGDAQYQQFLHSEENVLLNNVSKNVTSRVRKNIEYIEPIFSPTSSILPFTITTGNWRPQINIGSPAILDWIVIEPQNADGLLLSASFANLIANQTPVQVNQLSGDSIRTNNGMIFTPTGYYTFAPGSPTATFYISVSNLNEEILVNTTSPFVELYDPLFIPPQRYITSPAELQDSYLSLRSYNTSRYEGSKTIGLKYNIYTERSSNYYNVYNRIDTINSSFTSNYTYTYNTTTVRRTPIGIQTVVISTTLGTYSVINLLAPPSSTLETTLLNNLSKSTYIRAYTADNNNIGNNEGKIYEIKGYTRRLIPIAGATPTNYNTVSDEIMIFVSDKITAANNNPTITQNITPFSPPSQLIDLEFLNVNPNYYGGDKSYGKTTSVDRQSYKVGWVKNIPSQSLNFYDKTQIQLKYLVDSNQNITDLTLKNNNLFEVQNTFKSGDTVVLSLSDAVKPSFQKNLDGIKSIFRGGYSYDPLIFRENNELLNFKTENYLTSDSSYSGIKALNYNFYTGKNTGNSIWLLNAGGTPYQPSSTPTTEGNLGFTWFENYGGWDTNANGTQPVTPMATFTPNALYTTQYSDLQANSWTSLDQGACSSYNVVDWGSITFNSSTRNSYTFSDKLAFNIFSASLGGNYNEDVDVTNGGTCLYKVPLPGTYNISCEFPFLMQFSLFQYFNLRGQFKYTDRNYDWNTNQWVNGPYYHDPACFHPHHRYGIKWKIFGVLQKCASGLDQTDEYNWKYVASTRVKGITPINGGPMSYDLNTNTITFPPGYGALTPDTQGDGSNLRNYILKLQLYDYENATTSNDPTTVSRTFSVNDTLRMKFFFLDPDRFWEIGRDMRFEIGKPTQQYSLKPGLTTTWTDIPIGRVKTEISDPYFQITNPNNRITTYNSTYTVSGNNVFTTTGSSIIFSNEIIPVLTTQSIFIPNPDYSTTQYYSPVFDSTPLQPYDLIRIGSIKSPTPDYYTVLNAGFVSPVISLTGRFITLTNQFGAFIILPFFENQKVTPFQDFFLRLGSGSPSHQFTISDVTGANTFLNGTYTADLVPQPPPSSNLPPVGETFEFISDWDIIPSTGIINRYAVLVLKVIAGPSISTTGTFTDNPNYSLTSNNTPLGGITGTFTLIDNFPSSSYVVNVDKEISSIVQPSQNFAILRPKPDETSVIINFKKSLGDVSQTILIPQDANDEIKNKVGTIFQSLNVDLSNQTQTNIQ